jgi:TRAP-type C4-dicarboxylate transport system permease small subunit
VLAFIRTVVRSLEERTSSLLSVLGAFSAVGLVAMMMVTVADATGRRFFSSPIYGSYEAVSFLLSLTFFFSLCYCTARKGHFAIDVATSRLPPRVRQYIVIIMYLLSALLLWLLASQLVVLALKVKATNLTGAQFTFLPIYTLVLVGAFCAVMTGWGFLVQFISLLVKAMERNGQVLKGNK